MITNGRGGEVKSSEEELEGLRVSDDRMDSGSSVSMLLLVVSLCMSEFGADCVSESWNPEWLDICGRSFQWPLGKVLSRLNDEK